MNCWHCGTEVIWGGDHDMEEEEEDYGDFDKARREKWLDDDLLDD